MPGDFPLSPSTKQMRLENASRQIGTDSRPIPFLRYYAYDTSSGRPLATEELKPNASTGLTPPRRRESPAST